MNNDRVLYVKSGCPWCVEVERYFEKEGIEVSRVTVSGNRDGMDEMVALSGQTKAPTMKWDGHMLADFGVEELVPFLEKVGV
ncbi:MAG: glutaredoxin family protein [Luteolibacter sp.]